MPAPKVEDRVLTHGRITLRPLTIEDVSPRYLNWLADPDVNRWLETRWEEQTRQKVVAFVSKCSVDGSTLWGIFAEDAGHIGNIKLSQAHPRHSYAEVSYFIGQRDQWGKGYATTAVKLVCEYAFKALRLHRVQAGCYGGNKASARVLKKSGFSSEGQMHRQLKTEHGWDDHHMFGRICEQVVL